MLPNFDGQQLAALRRQHNLTQAALADALSIRTVDVIRRWEKGAAQPSASHLMQLCVVFKCPVMAFASD